MKEHAKRALKEFIYEVNRYLMGEYLIMEDKMVERHLRIEKLLHSKISSRFVMRPLTKHDFGYMIEHIHGGSGKTFEEYAYRLPVKKEDGVSKVREYDFLKLQDVEIKEKGRKLIIDRDDGKPVYVSYFSIADVVEDLEFPSSEIIYEAMGALSFPCDISMQIDVIDNITGISLEPIFEKLVLAGRKAPIVCVLGSMAMQMFMVLLLILQYVRSGNAKQSIYLIPLVILWATIMVATPAFCLLRYLFPVFLLWTFMIAEFFVPDEAEVV